MFMFICLSLLPNIGFWFDAIVYKENFACWYNPPTSELEGVIQNILSTSAGDLRKKSNELEKKLKKMEMSPNKDPTLEMKIKKELASVKESLAQADVTIMKLNTQMKDSLVAHSRKCPKILWLFSAANIGLGLASYVMWAGKSYTSLLVYGILLGLYWSYYPVLFEVGSKPLSAAHASLTSLVAGLTTKMFIDGNIVGGFLMMPFDWMLVYLTMEIVETPQDKADVRLFISNELHFRAASIILPNSGFWSGTYIFREYFTGWHAPARSEAESVIVSLLHATADIPNLKEERDALVKKLETLRKSSGSMDKEAQETICRYAENLAEVNRELREKEKQLINWDLYKDALYKNLQSSRIRKLPKIFWAMTAANTSMGFASYFVWKSENSFNALAAYGSVLLLYWTYYPVLFTFGWKNLSAVHAVLTGVAAGVTTWLFWSRSQTAGFLMVPFLGALAYVSWDIFGISQEITEVRLYAAKTCRFSDHITIKIHDQLP